MTGVGQMLRLARPDTKIIATEPENASLLADKPFAPHKIQVRTCGAGAYTASSTMHYARALWQAAGNA